MEVASTVDMESISFDTEGYSGADLQAMMYNAHLEVIHAQIDSVSTAKGDINGKTVEKSKSTGKGKGKGKAVDVDDDQEIEKIEEMENSMVGYRAIPEQSGSRAEKAAFDARVSLIGLLVGKS
jgi:peroxin-1